MLLYQKNLDSHSLRDGDLEHPPIGMEAVRHNTRMVFNHNHLAGSTVESTPKPHAPNHVGAVEGEKFMSIPSLREASPISLFAKIKSQAGTWILAGAK